MLELVLCSLLTIFPDYLYRRYAQGKRFGHEINLFSVWFELRWGIVSCIMLTIGLITVIFYFHPSTSSVTSFFRTVPIVSETNGRVAEIFVRGSERIEKGAPIFRLDSSQQEAAVEAARRRIAETEAAIVVAQTDLLAADAQIQQARSALQQAVDELQTKEELNRRNADIVAVVVDIIAGASAGGINGTMLARALCHDLPITAQRGLWLLVAIGAVLLGIFIAPAIYALVSLRLIGQDGSKVVPSVTVKDYTYGGSAGFPNPKPGGQPERFPTIWSACQSVGLDPEETLFIISSKARFFWLLFLSISSQRV